MSSLTFKTHCAALLFAALAGCGDDAKTSQQSGIDAVRQAQDDGKVECALAGSTKFERTCSTEQITTNGAVMLVLRHPGGGFRRFNVLTDGRGLAPAEGFDETRILLLNGSMIELSSGDDKYRLPAQIKNPVSVDDSTSAKDAS